MQLLAEISLELHANPDLLLIITPHHACAARGQVIAHGLDILYSSSAKKIFKDARYSYRSVVLRNVLSLSARRPQIDLRG